MAGDSYEISTTINAAPALSRSPSLAALYDRLRTKDEADGNSARIAEKLQHFCATSPDGDVRGLEEKLTSAERTDILNLAQRLKQEATKVVMSLQTSPTAQAIMTMVLSKIYTDFTMYVRPAIETNSTRVVIDQLIADRVISPIMEMLGDNDLMLTDSDVLGLLFFLGGNCHIRWDKC